MTAIGPPTHLPPLPRARRSGGVTPCCEGLASRDASKEARGHTQPGKRDTRAAQSSSSERRTQGFSSLAWTPGQKRSISKMSVSSPPSQVESLRLPLKSNRLSVEGPQVLLGAEKSAVGSGPTMWPSTSLGHPPFLPRGVTPDTSVLWPRRFSWPL